MKARHVQRAVCYHTGFLMYDRCKDSSVDRAARQMMRLYEAGRITLVQRKVRAGVYEYWAIRNRDD